MLRPLPRGTLVAEWLLPEWWRAVVKKPPPRRQQHSGKGGGGGGGGGGGSDSATAQLEGLLLETDETDETDEGGGSAVPPTSTDIGQSIYDPSPPPPADGAPAAAVPSGAALEAIQRLRAADGCPTEVLAFGTDELSDPRVALGVGDVVGIQLCVHAASGRVRPARVRLVRAAPVVKERGVAIVLKEGFGFLRCETREGQARPQPPPAAPPHPFPLPFPARPPFADDLVG